MKNIYIVKFITRKDDGGINPELSSDVCAFLSEEEGKEYCAGANYLLDKHSLLEKTNSNLERLMGYTGTTLFRYNHITFDVDIGGAKFICLPVRLQNAFA